MTDRLADLTAQGVSLWLDNLSRQRLHSGYLKDLIGVVWCAASQGLVRSFQ